MVKNLLHVALCVSNLARARHFYGDVLGLQEIARPDIFESKGMWFDAGGGCELHLTQAGPAPAAPSAIRNHVAFRIENYESALAALRSAGVEYQADLFGYKQIFVSDSDHNLIELQEVDTSGLPQRLTTASERRNGPP